MRLRRLPTVVDPAALDPWIANHEARQAIVP
jgi:hypothetical protein